MVAMARRGSLGYHKMATSGYDGIFVLFPDNFIQSSDTDERSEILLHQMADAVSNVDFQASYISPCFHLVFGATIVCLVYNNGR